MACTKGNTMAKPAKTSAPKAETPAKAENSTPKAETPKEKEQRLTFADLTALPVGDPATYLKRIVSVDEAVTKAKTVFTQSLQFHAKCVAALKRAYVDRLNKREIPPDTTFKAYFEQNAGGPLPGRVEALASLFNALVLTVDANGKPLLSEENFDAAAVDWLEKANAIVKTAMKEKGDAWKTSDEVLDLVNALSKPGDAHKKIKDIRKRQKGTETAEDGETTAVALTVGRAIEFLKAAIQDAKKLPEKDGYELFCDTVALSDTWAESGLPDPTLNTWMAKYDKAAQKGLNPKIELIDKPAETPAEMLAAAQPAAIAA